MKITKIKKYLGEIDCDSLEYDYKLNLDYFFKKFHNIPTLITNPKIQGGCSTIRLGNIVGRNYDWLYNDSPSFVLRVKGEKHNSIALANFSEIKEKDLEEKDLKNNFMLLPYFTTDGINDSGVFVSELVVPLGDKGFTTGTHPELDGDLICMQMLPRYILDNFSTAESAVDWIVNKAKIYGLYGKDIQEEIHFFIADIEKSYIVEFIDNVAVATENPVQPYMTNFYLDGVEYNEDGSLDFNSVTPYGGGLERYDLITQRLNDADDVINMRSLLTELNYTNAYNLELNPLWKTEFVGKYETMGDLTVTTPIEEFAKIYEYTQKQFKNRSRDENSPYFGSWQTVHSSIFDLQNKKLNVVVQEDGEEIEFDFDTKKDVTNEDIYIAIQEAITHFTDLEYKNVFRAFPSDRVFLPKNNNFVIMTLINSSKNSTAHYEVGERETHVRQGKTSVVQLDFYGINAREYAERFSDLTRTYFMCDFLKRFNIQPVESNDVENLTGLLGEKDYVDRYKIEMTIVYNTRQKIKYDTFDTVELNRIERV